MVVKPFRPIRAGCTSLQTGDLYDIEVVPPVILTFCEGMSFLDFDVAYFVKLVSKKYARGV